MEALLEILSARSEILQAAVPSLTLYRRPDAITARVSLPRFLPLHSHVSPLGVNLAVADLGGP
jgi:hypothetical protein